MLVVSSILNISLLSMVADVAMIVASKQTVAQGRIDEGDANDP